MKVKLQRAGLLAAVKLAGSAAAGRTTNPVLSCLKLTADGDGLTVEGTDLEMSLRYSLLGVEVLRAGAACVAADRLGRVLAEADGDEVSIDAGENTAAVRAGHGRYSLPVHPADQFPESAAFGVDGAFTVNAGTLRGLIGRTAFAADRKEGVARYAVTGVQWEVADGSLRLTATDTKRLATGTVDVAGGSGTALLPREAVAVLERSLADPGADVAASLTDRAAAFRCGPVELRTKLVEGRFPPWRDIIPKKSAVRLELNPAEFLRAVRQAAVMSDAESKRVECVFAPGSLTLTAQGADTGSGEVVTGLPGYDGPEVSIAFDPQYLVEMLRAVEGEPALAVEMTDGSKPAVFRVGADYCYLVMPLAS